MKSNLGSCFNMIVGVILGLIILTGIIVVFSYFPRFTTAIFLTLLLAVIIYSLSLTKGKKSKSYLNLFSDRTKK